MNPTLDDEIIPLSVEDPAPHRDPTPYGQHTVVPEIQGRRNLGMIRNVTRPALVVHRPAAARATGTGVIVCPGGSFATLTDTGTVIAKQLAAQGITAFVLRYRVLPTPVRDEDFLRQWATVATMADIEAQSHVAVADGSQAVRLVREQAARWRLDPERIGILGTSAGGLVTLAAATGYDPRSRPDFAAPIYPATWHEYRVPDDAPPLFLCLAADDEGDGVLEGNLALHRNWLAAGRPVEMHVYERGGHGFAEGPRGLPCDTWLDRFLDWLRMHEF
ncbi:alpha/beta hydrolase [Nocardia mexicana]|uniref:Acetyl esterase/lipase n=1 Tax=Nocardia mexicana TaxID=279262 RepID=A0A370H9U4_9NOCA|nr:alpha/beta hydrolase [Nocardia mexicana]RDI53299.1 acetyl esterase/lipase [Nocardia mexicana]